MSWPKQSYYWQEGDDLFISIPFTWELPKVKNRLAFCKNVHVGGPAVDLMPNYFKNCENVVQIGGTINGVLQRINPYATRTTTGCPNHCKYCAIGRGLIEKGGFQELKEWPDLPILADNNLFSASISHLDKVFDRLEKHERVDFEQGLDCRLLTDYHAERCARLNKPIIRFACDNRGEVEELEKSLDLLWKYKIPKSWVRVYAMIGFNSDPDEAWERCQMIEKHKVKALPMWFHELDSMKWNQVTAKQKDLGWSNYERRRIMAWYYWHTDIRKTKRISRQTFTKSLF